MMHNQEKRKAKHRVESQGVPDTMEVIKFEKRGRRLDAAMRA